MNFNLSQAYINKTSPTIRNTPFPTLYTNSSLLKLYRTIPKRRQNQAFPQELANSDEHLQSQSSKRLILKLYEALNASPRHVSTVHTLIAPDLEWWFHGPPAHQYLLRLLTGHEVLVDFDFVPQSVTAFGNTVLVEGCDPVRRVSWVHAWTLTDGIITAVREYFNTSVTVTRFGSGSGSGSGDRLIHCPSVWESSCSEQVGKSVPGLVLAI